MSRRTDEKDDGKEDENSEERGGSVAFLYTYEDRDEDEDKVRDKDDHGDEYEYETKIYRVGKIDRWIDNLIHIILTCELVVCLLICQMSPAPPPKGF
jgi:hypothetical protein